MSGRYFRRQSSKLHALVTRGDCNSSCRKSKSRERLALLLLLVVMVGVESGSNALHHITLRSPYEPRTVRMAHTLPYLVGLRIGQKEQSRARELRVRVRTTIRYGRVLEELLLL